MSVTFGGAARARLRRSPAAGRRGPDRRRDRRCRAGRDLDPGANLFSGYWPDGDGGPGDGWFATGDIGYLAAGALFLVDRARELIIVNGFNVYPAEVEGAIGELTEVDSVAVVGRADARTGEQVVAFVTGRATAETIMEHCEARLAKFKRPRLVRVVDELPRGATGKVQKGLLRARAQRVRRLRCHRT